MMRPGSHVGRAWASGSCRVRQRMKCIAEIVLGWNVVEWNVDFAELFQRS
jgi:hypothetical protein